MQLFIGFITAALAQVDYESLDLTEPETLGSGDSELAQFIDANDAKWVTQTYLNIWWVISPVEKGGHARVKIFLCCHR